MTINETLGLIGSLTKKIEKEAHDLQYLVISNEDLRELQNFSTKIQNLSFEMHRLHTSFKGKYSEETPELDEKGLANLEMLTRMRKFDGRGGRDFDILE